MNQSATNSARPQQATMKDVARVAGVALKTVSRVVNDEPGVSPPVRKKVKAVIAELGYRRNDSARVLRMGTTHSIGFICEDLGEPFVSQLIRAIESVSLENSSMLIVAATGGNLEREQDAVRALASRQVDGLIIAPTGREQPYLSRELGNGLPIVFVDRPSLHHQVDTVLTDNHAGAQMATRQLVKCGHRRIAFFGNADQLFTQVERIEGYRQALTAEGIAFDDALVCSASGNPAATLASLKKMLALNEPITAAITGDSLCTYALLRAFKVVGLHLPFIGFDDFPLADLLEPGISVVEQNPYDIGRVATQLLFRRIGGDTSPPQTIKLGTRLIQRGSGETGLQSPDGSLHKKLE